MTHATDQQRDPPLPWITRRLLALRGDVMAHRMTPARREVRWWIRASGPARRGKRP